MTTQDSRQEWMTDDQYECLKLLADVVGGFHHIYTKVKACGDGITTSICHTWATWDFNELTKLVVLAHDRMIRVEIAPCNMQHWKLILHKRHTRTGLISQRMPTIEEQIEKIRNR